ncbi:hypothetical protein BZG36_02440 [Bifiguratus adelaidae]|uniref:Uncharacterized protein n=1 Tax=Bifiguratus adelaidae TaxID=1938954 RepID=A0A261Y3Q4_9FUNG|nr:hypothetical protein BZG36_02440 [Bifiguratus adelaidae]
MAWIRRQSSIEIPPGRSFYYARKSPEELASLKNKGLRAFYEKQNELIDAYQDIDNIIRDLQASGANGHRTDVNASPGPTDMLASTVEHPIASQAVTASPTPVMPDLESGLTEHTPLLTKAADDKKTSRKTIALAINLSFIINFLMLVSKIFVAVVSGSVSILASAFESFLDFFSNAIIFFTIRVIKKQDLYSYPVGKARMEPLGILVFAVITATSFTQVLITSIQRLLGAEDEVEVDLSTLSLILLAINLLAKLCLWIWCRSIKGSSSVRALAQDHENDVVFNGVGFFFPIIATYAHVWQIDPIGGILLSVYIIYEWIQLLLDNIRRLSGQVASTEDLKKITYMAYRFSPLIQCLDTVRAYYVGDRLFVEIDIVMPPKSPLNVAHDVGEALQNAIEKMDNVERAFVHLDYEWTHTAEHQEVVQQVGFGGDM